jgi:hypothetical protein
VIRPLPPLGPARDLIEHLIPNADPNNDSDMLAVGNMVVATKARDEQIGEALLALINGSAYGWAIDSDALRAFVAKLNGAEETRPEPEHHHTSGTR